MIEENNLSVQRLCYILHKIRVEELKLERARYRGAYLRKIRNAINNKNDIVPLVDGYDKWKNNPKGLEEEIQTARLNILKEQEKFLRYKKKMRPMLNTLLSRMNAALVFREGKVLGVEIDKYTHFIQSSKFEELADEYEAAVALNKVLST